MPERLLSFSELVDSLCLLTFKAFEENTILNAYFFISKTIDRVIYNSIESEACLHC